MRLHRLTVTAIGPFADEQVIDIERVSAGGLFLLEGPTGAGKSTVLDAIAFALYGRVAGSDSDQARLHSHHAPADLCPSVSLEFTVSGRRHRITRVPEHERPKRRGTGVTVQKAQVRLEVRADGEWHPLSTSAHEVGVRITELLGLSRDQFTQVVLLPQGEFARFLSADDDERRALLSRLFRVQDYDRLTAWLQDAARDARLQESEAARALRDALTALAEGGRIEATQSATWLDLVEPWSPEGVDELEQALATAEALLVAESAAAHDHRDTLAGRRRAADARAREAAQRWHLMQEFTELRGRHDAHRAGLDRWRRDQERLARADQARSVAPLVARLRREQELSADLLGRAHSGVGLGTADTADPEQAARRFTGASRSALADAAALRHLVEVEERLPVRRQQVQDLLDEVRTLSDEGVAAERAGAQLPIRIDELERRRDALALLRADAVEAEAAIPAARRRRDAASELVEVSAALDVARSALHAAVDVHQCHVDRVQELLQRRIEGIAADLAERLVPGEPCQVCGSPEHPAPVRPGGRPRVSEADVAAAVEERDAAQQRRQYAEGERDRLVLHSQELQAAGAGLSVAQADDELAGLSARVAAADGADAEGQQIEQDLARTLAESAALESATAERTATIAALTARADELSRAIDADAATVSAAAGGLASVADRVADLTQQAQEHAARAELLRDVAGARAAADATHTEAHDAAVVAGFADVVEAERACLPETERQALAASVREWQNRDTGLAAQLADDRFAGLEREQPERLAADHESAAAALQAVAAEHDAATTTAAALSERERRFADLRHSVVAALAERSRLARDNAAVIALARLAAGRDAAALHRMTLTTYVLRRWFGDVVDAANQRLGAIAGGKYSLDRCETGDRRNDRVGLGLRVFDHHTGRDRSPASLSGGERFYTSLALALGLSDVVRAEAGGAGLDTLFVDEGFGTLDPVTLDEVLGVIDGLRDNGRVVGIVSHVAELKERIPERLEIARVRDDGPSRVRVVA